MVIVWPRAMRLLRETAAHSRRRLNRMEKVAQDAMRVKWVPDTLGDDNRLDWRAAFPTARAYAEGKADAFEEALQIIGDSAIDEELEIDREVVQLAQSGLDVEQIAGRCGLSIEEVAAALALFAKLAGQEAPDAEA
jgi:hypothetical protein